ncbi:MAG: hypothetical protein A3C93_05710 [Candidatus Lloydbacteria bacterium RIFCSPHIGHO2_02_FULL_54_17]|uniref:TrbC/VIRB2 family protein n=1 Tax=Candidatus Lloydbacteria bacterium RIFCSPHIGHO2_02_FULL_54_17 TaxID=1798664 RepID=A0A1G2DD50_9BACT|nr:MAG: hypothetical protein A2762_03180 [Candidatus Lloydbacteria bacterium RIFCSPHIGHO2_01_FULL_54_11]OGZ10780.1 MAG: hypothetical protein A3C93_05710 [Candidatus Lloydbacteria bacterium RIFCSPHIGHO2_02_FULL_54_17]OGZ13081.1 MAG: hypothetical protein A2948_03690 [Candidatus Lloydbacteria bacterium RIFCSPLOWO2_01_FULL_54_18]OGZ16528.1 MAG: hypothetical protein A3H76_04550 [Candidatus Lloydbacteria bacterium RIFCSPLOWO2_02_FULL_54_12]
MHKASLASTLLLQALFLPRLVFAATPPDEVLEFVGKISTNILNPLIMILFALAFVYFVYGVAAYIWNPDNEEARTKGKMSMLWGVVGMFIMVSVFGIMKFIISSIGADDALMNYV